MCAERDASQERPTSAAGTSAVAGKFRAAAKAVAAAKPLAGICMCVCMYMSICFSCWIYTGVCVCLLLACTRVYGIAARCQLMCVGVGIYMYVYVMTHAYERDTTRVYERDVTHAYERDCSQLSWSTQGHCVGVWVCFGSSDRLTNSSRVTRLEDLDETSRITHNCKTVMSPMSCHR